MTAAPSIVEPIGGELAPFIARYQTMPVPVRPLGRARTTDTPELLLGQPHPADCALSIGGTLLQIVNTVCLMTVFSESIDGIEASAGRKAEDRRYAEVTTASWSSLGLEEHVSSGAERTAAEHEYVATKLAEALGGQERAGVLLAPAGVGRHVDHRCVHDAAAAGSWVFWEDVAFRSIYGASVEDRIDFSLRTASWLRNQVLLAVDITYVVDAKAALLACYPSQSDQRWRPLRFGWAAARELGRQAFCERFFVPHDRVGDIADILGLTLEPGPALTYGVVQVPAVWATVVVR